MKMQQIREMTDVELNGKFDELRQEKFSLKIKSKNGQLENTARAGQVRGDIARIKTEQRRRQTNANG